MQEDRTQYFGDHWRVPMLENAERVDTPIGENCLYCDEPVRLGDQGVIRPYLSTLGPAIPAPIHRECDLRMILGGINHLKGTCTCHGGTDDPDPPGLTRRQAARLVLIHTRHPAYQATLR